VEITYAYTAYDWPSLESALAVFAFTWPLLFVFGSLLKPGLNQAFYINVIELFLCLGSVAMITAITYFDELMSGVYLAALSLMLYSAASILKIIEIAKTRIYKNRT